MNLNTYTNEMAKSIWDKAFFMDKIPGAKCVIDFGCADASMICMLSEIFPSIDFFGYDNNLELIQMARTNLSSASANCRAVYSDQELEQLVGRVKRNYKPEEICINFSSVLHEVFSCSSSGKATIKTLVNELNPKYITIRDMYWHVDSPEYDFIWSMEKINYIERCTNIAPGKYKQFVAKYGVVKTWKDMVHFLMKFQWRDNGYERELEENYFSWQLNDFLDLVGNYKPIFETHYMLPYLYEKWKITPNHHTHAQFILRSGM